MLVKCLAAPSTAYRSAERWSYSSERPSDDRKMMQMIKVTLILYYIFVRLQVTKNNPISLVNDRSMTEQLHRYRMESNRTIESLKSK